MPQTICDFNSVSQFTRTDLRHYGSGARRTRVHGLVRAWLVLAVTLLIAWACMLPQAQAQTRTDRIQVVATFSILADMVREVGGDRIELTTIVGPNGDAHVFEPTPRDARALGVAQVLVRNGLDFEGWLPRLLEASSFKGRDIIASEGVRPRVLGGAQQVREVQEHAGEIDPHAWQDLANGVIYVRNIARGLASVDPDHADEYQRRAESYISQLQDEDRAWRRSLEAIPLARRVMMTSHDAFGYLGQAYGIQLISVVGLSSEAEPAARTIAALIDRIRAEHIHALFLEKTANPALMRQITQETGAGVGGTLYADTLDQPGTPAGTYLGMFHWNARQILAAFEG